MDVQQGGTDADPGAAATGGGEQRGQGSRVWLIVAIGVALVATLVLVVIMLSSDAGGPAAEPTPTVTAAPTPSTAPTPTPTPTPSETATPSPLPGASLGPFTGGSQPGVEGTWIADVRAAGQDGFDRVVVEFTGVVPTYRVDYADPPFVAVNDETVEVAGTAFLRVRMDGTSTFNLDDGVPVYDGPKRVVSDTTVVTEVVDVEDFEGVVVWVIGLDATSPARVSTLQDPGRLVIDVEH